MRFLVDECAGPALADWLVSEGYDVFNVFREARGSTDEQLLTKAVAESWIIITTDKDFGEMIHKNQHPHCGVVLLRLRDERSPAKMQRMSDLLKSHADRLDGRFVVVTERQVRFRSS